jgi:hypothetical protein
MAAAPSGVHRYGRLRLYADTVESGSHVVDKKDNGRVYEVHWVRSEAVALEYLRRRDVRIEGYYVIVETPHRTLGRDMIMIYDEVTGSMIEIAARTPLPEPQPSPTHCIRCGYPVLPANATDDEPGTIIAFAQSPAELVYNGMGYRCTSCGSAACAACYQVTGENTVAGEITWHRCWACESPVTAFTE